MASDPTIPTGGVASDPNLWEYPDGTLVFPNGYPGPAAPSPPTGGDPPGAPDDTGGFGGLVPDEAFVTGPAIPTTAPVESPAATTGGNPSAAPVDFTDPVALGGLAGAAQGGGGEHAGSGDETSSFARHAAAPIAYADMSGGWDAWSLYELDLSLRPSSGWHLT